MAKQTCRERFVRRYFTKKGIDIDQHPNITGIYLEGDDNRVIGFTTVPDDEVVEEAFEHPARPGVYYAYEGAAPVFENGEDRSLGSISGLTVSEVLKYMEIPYLDPYNLLDMLERAEDIGLTEFDPCCQLYFVHKVKKDQFSIPMHIYYKVLSGPFAA